MLTGRQKRERFCRLVLGQAMRFSVSFPGRDAACNAASQTRDRYASIAWNGPGSADQHFMLIRVRDKGHMPQP